MAKNIEVLYAFVNGESKPKTKNLYIEGDKLFNYGTCIAERWEKIGGQEYGFAVNVTKYSMSTTTIQNQLIRLLEHDPMVKYLAPLPMGVDSLVAK